jgi:hypothetical protein
MRSRSRDTTSVILATAIVALSAAHQAARAQEPLQIPASEMPRPGVAKDIPKDVMLQNGTASVNALSAPLTGRALTSLFKDSVPRTRGAQDISLFRNDAP